DLEAGRHARRERLAERPPPFDRAPDHVRKQACTVDRDADPFLEAVSGDRFGENIGKTREFARPDLRVDIERMQDLRPTVRLPRHQASSERNLRPTRAPPSTPSPDPRPAYRPRLLRGREASADG